MQRRINFSQSEPLLIPYYNKSDRSYNGIEKEENYQMISNISNIPSQIIKVEQDSALFSIPDELFLVIFSKLKLTDLCSVNLTCRKFKAILKDDLLWRHLFISHFPHSVKPESHWVEAYKRCHHLDSNQRKGLFTTKFLEKGAGYGYGLCRAGNILVSSHSENIMVWDLKTQGCIGSLAVRAFYVAIDAKSLYIPYQNEIHILDINTLRRIGLLVGDYGKVTCFAIEEETLYSGSDRKIMIWNLKTQERIATLVGHEESIKGIIVNRNTLYSSSTDGTVRIWNLSTHECIAILRVEKEKTVSSFVLVDNWLYTCTAYGIIQIWNVETFECTARFESYHLWSDYCIAVVGNHLFCGTHREETKIWDLKTFKCIETLKGKGSSVSRFNLMDNAIISYSSHGLMIWNFSATETEILEEIAQHFLTPNDWPLDEELRRFHHLPPKVKDEIYKELEIILQNANPHFCAEEAFLNGNHQNTNIAQKRMAILNYLAKQNV